MKKLQKYTSMAFLLISVATIVPAYANPEIVESQKTETVWYNRPEVREQIYTACHIGGLVIVSAAMYMFMLKMEARRFDPVYQWEKNGILLNGWEVIDGKLIKKQ